MTNKTDKNGKETRSGAQSKIEQLPTDTNPKRASVYEQITERIIGLLTKGTIPWHKPWQIQTGLPRNLVSKKAYRGINVFLGSSGITRGFFIGWFEGTGKKAKEFIGWNPGWAKPGQGGAT